MVEIELSLSVLLFWCIYDRKQRQLMVISYSWNFFDKTIDFLVIEYPMVSKMQSWRFFRQLRWIYFLCAWAPVFKWSQTFNLFPVIFKPIQLDLRDQCFYSVRICKMYCCLDGRLVLWVFYWISKIFSNCNY